VSVWSGPLIVAKSVWATSRKWSVVDAESALMPALTGTADDPAPRSWTGVLVP